jgi:hypothetical protein
MDVSTTSFAAENEIQFQLSLLRLSYLGQPEPQATGALEQLLPAKVVN